MKIRGIYKLTNTINGKVYVGSSNDILKRFRDHKRALKSNTHHSEHLQRAVNKYGISKFKTDIIRIVTKEENIFLIEKEIIESYNSISREFGYNMSLPNELGGIEHHSEISKEKLRKISYKYHRGTIEGYEEFRLKRLIYLNRIKRPHKKHNTDSRIVVLNRDESYYKEFNSIYECSKELSLCSTKIEDCVTQRYNKHNKRRMSVGGYRFLKKDIYDSGNYSFKENTKTIYQQLDDNGSIIAEFVGFSGLDATGEFKHSSVVSAISRGQKYKGFTFRVKPTPYMYKREEIQA